LSTFISNIPTTERFPSAKCIARKTQLLPMYASLSCSSPTFHHHADIKQALKQAMKKAYKQDIKQASE